MPEVFYSFGWGGNEGCNVAVGLGVTSVAVGVGVGTVGVWVIVGGRVGVNSRT